MRRTLGPPREVLAAEAEELVEPSGSDSTDTLSGDTVTYSSPYLPEVWIENQNANK